MGIVGKLLVPFPRGSLNRKHGHWMTLWLVNTVTEPGTCWASLSHPGHHLWPNLPILSLRMHIGHGIHWCLRSCLWGPGLVALVKIPGSTLGGWLFFFSKVSNIIGYLMGVSTRSLWKIIPWSYYWQSLKLFLAIILKIFFNFNFVIVNIFNSSTFKTNFKVYYIVVIKRMMLYNRYLEFISLCLNNFMSIV